MTNKQINITGAIFDFDGTLFDSMHVWKGYKDNFFKHLGIELTEEDKEAFKGLFLRETFLLAIERFNLDKTYEELLATLFDYIKSRYMVETEPKNDIKEFLEKLKAKYPGAKITPVGIYQPEGAETKNITFHIEK